MKTVSMSKERFLKGSFTDNGTISHFHYIDHSKMIGDRPTIESLGEFTKNHIKEWNDSLQTNVFPTVYTIRFSYYADPFLSTPWAVDYFVFKDEGKALEAFKSHICNLLSLSSETKYLSKMVVLYPGCCSDLIAIPKPVPVVDGPHHTVTDEFQITDYAIFKYMDDAIHIERPSNGPSLDNPETALKPLIF